MHELRCFSASIHRSLHRPSPPLTACTFRQVIELLNLFNGLQKGPEDVGTWFIINFYCQRIPMIQHDQVTGQSCCNLLRFCCSTPREIQVRNGQKQKKRDTSSLASPALFFCWLNEWLALHSCTLFIHSFIHACTQRRVGVAFRDYTNACNILIHSLASRI